MWWWETSLWNSGLIVVQKHTASCQFRLLSVDLLAAPASQAFVERLFSVCGMVSHDRRNRMEKSLEMRVWLKVNFSVLLELEYKKTLCNICECDRDVLEWPSWQLTWCFMYGLLLTNWNLSVSWIVSLSGSQLINLSWHDVNVIIDHTMSYWQILKTYYITITK